MPVDRLDTCTNRSQSQSAESRHELIRFNQSRHSRQIRRLVSVAIVSVDPRTWLEQWSTLVGSCVDSIERNWPWLALSTVIDSDWHMCRVFRLTSIRLMCHFCRLWLALIGSNSTLLTVIDPDWLMCQLWRLCLIFIGLSSNSVDYDWPWLAHEPNRVNHSRQIEPVRVNRHCQIRYMSQSRSTTINSVTIGPVRVNHSQQSRYIKR